MEQEFLEMLAENEYEEVRLLPTGEYAALQRMMFTYSLCLGLDGMGHRVRWCFKTREEASVALRNWDGRGDPMGMWIVQKPGERQNPRRST